MENTRGKGNERPPPDIKVENERLQKERVKKV